MSETNSYPFLQRPYFASLAEKHNDVYRQASPFPHVVIDDFLPSSIAEMVHDAFPRSDLKSFEQPDNSYQVNKLGRSQNNDFLGVSESIRHFLADLNGAIFVDFLEALTGIKGLTVDPHYQGGAMHQILPGGRLDIHADFNRHPRLKLDRRLNVLIYFNKNWDSSYGGNLELWSKDMSTCVKTVAPVFNRCVVFNTTSDSYHGHPVPLSCPPNRTRNSIALYYYTNGRPESEIRQAHSTLWQTLPEK